MSKKTETENPAVEAADEKTRTRKEHAHASVGMAPGTREDTAQRAVAPRDSGTAPGTPDCIAVPAAPTPKYGIWEVVRLAPVDIVVRVIGYTVVLDGASPLTRYRVMDADRLPTLPLADLRECGEDDLTSEEA